MACLRSLRLTWRSRFKPGLHISCKDQKHMLGNMYGLSHIAVMKKPCVRKFEALPCSKLLGISQTTLTRELHNVRYANNSPVCHLIGSFDRALEMTCSISGRDTAF